MSLSENEKEQREFRHRRELFAGMAMQGILSNRFLVDELCHDDQAISVAKFSVMMADALIKELEEKKDE